MLVVAPDQDRKLREWVDAGLIAADQAQAIRQHEAGDLPLPAGTEAVGTPEGRRIPLLGEALGYLGGALVVIAGGILLAEYWDRLRFGAKLALAALLTGVLFAVGVVLRDVAEAAAQRLAGFSWAFAVGGAAWFVGLLAGRDGLGFDAAPQAFTVSSIAALAAVGMWVWRVRWQQHVVTYLAVGATIVSALALPAQAPEAFFFGFALTALALVWLLLGNAQVARPVVTARWVGLVGLLVGLRVMPTDPYESLGLVLTVSAALALLGAGVVFETPMLLGFGAAAVFLFVPQAVFHFFGETLGAPVALLLSGLVLITTALVAVRARREEVAP